MRKIVLLPLDERPCNAKFPKKLFDGEKLEVCIPECLGEKKKPADVRKLAEFLWRACEDAYGLVLSMDMLLYGGLLPSRIHHLDQENAEERLQLVKKLRNDYPNLKIYAFQCIMRCPSYSSSDEEPDYYEEHGALIHQAGIAQHRQKLGLCTQNELAEAVRKVPAEALSDYLDRRTFNLEFNKKTLELVKEGIIDFLVFPQDDSAPFGYPAQDQQEIRNAIITNHLQTRVLMYPGADEVGMTLLSRMLLEELGRRPRVYVKYAADAARRVIPSYEDRSLAETLKAHLLAAGFRMTESDTEADLILGLTCPGGPMEEADIQPVRNAAYCVERNLTEFVLAIKEWIREGKRVLICDDAYANGADLELIDLLDREGLLLNLSGYAGWNTNANSLGTVLAMGAYVLVYGETKGWKDFLMQRYVEDAGYCAVVREQMKNGFAASLGMSYFDVREQKGAASAQVKRLLDVFVREYLPSIAKNIRIEEVIMPWKRLFEVDVTVHWNDTLTQEEIAAEHGEKLY